MKYVATDKAPAAIGPYSQAIENNGLVYVSGQLGMQPADGEMVDGFEAQTRQALENMKAILEESGSSLEQVISVDVFMTDLGKFVDFNAIYAEYFSSHKPARAAIEVSALPKGGLVEMKCIAAK